MATNERRPRASRTRNQTRTKNPPPDVVYTPAREFNRSRLVLNLLTIAAVAFAVFLGLSIFFNVEQVTVSGANRYSEWSICEASGIQEGDSLLFFGQASAASKIIDALPYVKTVRFEIKLPGTVHIIVEEAPIAYSIEAQDGSWWLMTAQGRLVERVDAAAAGDYGKIQGVTVANPAAGETAVAWEAGESAVTGADRLSAALLILTHLEANELFDKVASVDVSNLQNMEFWYGKQYQVKLGDSGRMDEKVAAVRSTIAKLSVYQTGILDASFTTFPNSVGHMQFQD